MTSPATRPSSSNFRSAPPFNLQIRRGLPRGQGDGMFEGSRDSLPRASRNNCVPLCERCDSIFAGESVDVMAKRLWVLLGLLAMAPAFGAELKIGYVNTARWGGGAPRAGGGAGRRGGGGAGGGGGRRAGRGGRGRRGERSARDG